MFIEVHFLLTVCIDRIIGHEFKYLWDSNFQFILENWYPRILNKPQYIDLQFLDSLPGNYTRVKKALDNPRLYESLMTNPDVAAGNNPLSLTTLDPEVIKFAKDPILLLVLLRTDYTLMNKLMK